MLLLTAFVIGLFSAYSQKIQHIRNATAKINYGGKTFLIDPLLAKKGAYAGFEGTYRSELRNPMTELPFSLKKILKDVDAVIITHTHSDHWDDEAQKIIPKDFPIFVQDAKDEKLIRSQGFKNIMILSESGTKFGDVTLFKTGGQHGTDQMYAIPQLAEIAGEAMGVVFQAKNQKTLYLVGDTIFNNEVNDAIAKFSPEIYILNTGYARLNGFDGAIIMGKEDVEKIYHQSPKAKIIAVHMDAINHCMLSRAELRKFVKEKNFTDRVFIPNDGEKIKF